MALDDCRHQIKYLVKARNAVMRVPTRKAGLQTPETSFSGTPALNGATPTATTRTGLLTPGTSFSGEFNMETLKPATTIGKGILTPDTSFSSTTVGDEEPHPALISSPVPGEKRKAIQVQGDKLFNGNGPKRKAVLGDAVSKKLGPGLAEKDKAA